MRKGSNTDSQFAWASFSCGSSNARFVSFCHQTLRVICGFERCSRVGWRVYLLFLKFLEIVVCQSVPYKTWIHVLLNCWKQGKGAWSRVSLGELYKHLSQISYIGVYHRYLTFKSWFRTWPVAELLQSWEAVAQSPGGPKAAKGREAV